MWCFGAHRSFTTWSPNIWCWCGFLLLNSVVYKAHEWLCSHLLAWDPFFGHTPHTLTMQSPRRGAIFCKYVTAYGTNPPAYRDPPPLERASMPSPNDQKRQTRDVEFPPGIGNVTTLFAALNNSTAPPQYRNHRRFHTLLRSINPINHRNRSGTSPNLRKPTLHSLDSPQTDTPPSRPARVPPAFSTHTSSSSLYFGGRNRYTFVPGCLQILTR